MDGYNNQNQGYGQQDRGYGQQNQGYDNQSQGYGQQNQSYDNQDQGYNQQNQGYGQQNQGYGQQNQGYGQGQGQGDSFDDFNDEEGGDRGIKEFFYKEKKDQHGLAPGQQPEQTLDKSNVFLAAAAVAGAAFIGKKIYDNSHKEDDKNKPNQNQNQNQNQSQMPHNKQNNPYY